MENNISDFIKKSNIKLIMPSNANGWKCDWRKCGWCCVTEITCYHNKNKCSKFDTKTKECKIYDNRLIDCKLYPFMIINTNDGIILSPSLNCPYVMSSIKMPPLHIEDILLEEEVREFIWSYSDLHRKVMSQLDLIDTNTDLNNNIQQTNDLLKSLTFKELEDLGKFISNYCPFDIIESIRKYKELVAYVKPNYSHDGIPHPDCVFFRVTNKNHVIYKDHLETDIIKEINIPKNILIDDMAQLALKQYIELNINRHLEFDSLFIFRIRDPQFSAENAYMQIWISILYILYTHLILIGLREKVDTINYPNMREALSITDASLHSLILTKPNI